MSTRSLIRRLLACTLGVAACSSLTGPGFGDLGVLGGGYGSTTFQAFGQLLPSQFAYLYPPSTTDQRFTCFGDGYCGLAGQATAVGSLTNGGAPFVFISTANVPAGQNGGPQTIRASGIVTVDPPLTIPNRSEYSRLRLVLDWAFLTARFTPATFNDSMVVRVKSGNDSAVVFRVTSADLQAGRFPQRPGGCGTHALVGRTIAYGTCTDWQTTNIDLTAWLSRPSFVIQFVVGEAGTPVAGTDQPTTFVFRRATLEGSR